MCGITNTCTYIGMYVYTVYLYNTPPPLRVYLHNHCSIHPSSPAQLCASHKEEHADLNTRLSAQEEEMCQRAQLVITLQVRMYIHTEHLSAALSFNPTCTTFFFFPLLLFPHAISTRKYGSTYVRVSQMSSPSPTYPHCMTDMLMFLHSLYTCTFPSSPLKKLSTR